MARRVHDERPAAHPRHRALVAFLLVGVGVVQAWSSFGALVPLGPCGLGALRYDDSTWTVVHAQNFSEQAAPPHWRGGGLVTSVSVDRLTYRDLSGASLTFVPGDVNPTGCS